MQSLPPLLNTTKEGRRVYEFHAIINQRQINFLVIDPHYEKEHGDYMTDEFIYFLSQQAIKRKNFIFAGRQNQWEYFETDIIHELKNYRLVLCWEDKKDYLGVVDTYRKSKYDKKNKLSFSRRGNQKRNQKK